MKITIDTDNCGCGENCGCDNNKKIRCCQANIIVVEADFGGTDVYTNPILSAASNGGRNLRPQVDFNVFPNDGTGGLLFPGTGGGSGYSFNPATGSLTMPAGNYLIMF